MSAPEALVIERPLARSEIEQKRDEPQSTLNGRKVLLADSENPKIKIIDKIFYSSFQAIFISLKFREAKFCDFFSN